MSDQRTIYITGRGGDANKGLGAYLKALDANRMVIPPLITEVKSRGLSSRQFHHWSNAV